MILMINLQLGCGKLKLDNFINIDIMSDVADMKLDINDLSVFNNNTIDQIYICHVLEHIQRTQILNLFLEWNRVLKKDAILRIAVPDFEKVVKLYQQNENIPEIIGLVNGGQRNKYDIHFVIFDYNILNELLNICGFKKVERYDAFEFLGEKDDYSKSYLPHMDFKNGELMSLNIKCIKESDVNVDTINLSDNLKRYLKIIED
jgi:predicted SAM-dependent methyltransferase